MEVSGLSSLSSQDQILLHLPAMRVRKRVLFFSAESLRVKHLHPASLPPSVLSLGKLELISNEQMPPHL